MSSLSHAKTELTVRNRVLGLETEMDDLVKKNNDMNSTITLLKTTLQETRAQISSLTLHVEMLEQTIQSLDRAVTLINQIPLESMQESIQSVQELLREHRFDHENEHTRQEALEKTIIELIPRIVSCEQELKKSSDRAQTQDQQSLLILSSRKTHQKSSAIEPKGFQQMHVQIESNQIPSGSPSETPISKTLLQRPEPNATPFPFQTRLEPFLPL